MTNKNITAKEELEDERTKSNLKVGGNIRAYRVLLGKTLEETSEAVGVSFQQLRKYETGKDSVRIAYLHLIAEYFEISLYTLLNHGAKEMLEHAREQGENKNKQNNY